jgi:hypothetical protein
MAFSMFAQDYYFSFCFSLSELNQNTAAVQNKIAINSMTFAIVFLTS